MGLKSILRTTTSFSALTLSVGSFDPYKAVPDMTYNVMFSGMLNPTHSIILVSESGHKWSNAPSLGISVVNEERVRPVGDFH